MVSLNEDEQENSFENKLISLSKCRYLNEVIKLKHEAPLKERCRFSWVWPTEKMLNSLKIWMGNLCVKKILSIGCGSGLLEWMVQEYTGIKLYGLELDQSWWTSRYAPNTFIHLNFTTTEISSKFLSKICDEQSASEHNFALLFCYFNNGDAFCDYIKNYKGNTVIILGPGNEGRTHTNPKPLNPHFGESLDDARKWELKYSEEVGDSKDFIAVWSRNL